MALHWKEKPYDLVLTASLSVSLSLLAWLGVGGPVGVLAAVLVVLVLPGFAASAALFPATGELDAVRRLTLSVALSLAIVPFAGLVSNYSPMGVHVWSVLAVLNVATLGACAVAWVRRGRIPEGQRLRFSFAMPAWRREAVTAVDRYLVLGLSVAIAIGAATFAYSAMRPSPPDGFTEIFLLNETGAPGNYPVVLQPGEVGAVIVVVANHEFRAIDYTVEIRLTTLQHVVNRTTGLNETVEVANATLQVLAFNLADGASERTPYNFSIAQAGSYALKFLLYVGPPAADPYRAVRLLLTVR